MKAKAVATLGLLAIAGAASAASPSKPGLTGDLGDELFYNYVEGNVGRSYLDDGRRNKRVGSDQAYGFTGSVFLFAPVYLLASYDRKEFSFSTPATATAPLTRFNIEAEQTSLGLGARIPIAYATDLFASGSYEQVDGFTRVRQSGATTQRFSLDAEGAGYEAGVRSFISGFAELSVSYRYRETRTDQRSNTPGPTFGRREINKSSFICMGLVVPVLSQLSLFARAEIGEVDSNFSAADDQFENYLLGARVNFRL